MAQGRRKEERRAGETEKGHLTVSYLALSCLHSALYLRAGIPLEPRKIEMDELFRQIKQHLKELLVDGGPDNSAGEKEEMMFSKYLIQGE